VDEPNLKINQFRNYTYTNPKVSSNNIHHERLTTNFKSQRVWEKKDQNVEGPNIFKTQAEKYEEFDNEEYSSFPLENFEESKVIQKYNFSENTDKNFEVKLNNYFDHTEDEKERKTTESN